MFPFMHAAALSFASLPDAQPCDNGLLPTCRIARGFGLCNETAVQVVCPETCNPALPAGDLRGTEFEPSDYAQPLTAFLSENICEACTLSPEMACCQTDDGDGLRARLSHNGYAPCHIPYKCITANWGIRDGNQICGPFLCAGKRDDGRYEICDVSTPWNAPGCGAMQYGLGYVETPAYENSCSRCGWEMNMCYGYAAKICCRWGMAPGGIGGVAAIDEDNAPYWS